ncbi:NAD-dependent epimerase/dehydratase family protein [Halalkalibacterium halodurans]|uniref:UDP-2-acetamido-2,6-dideoxy-hexulose 4-reductase n=1 Tax=Halalkalibacterium halodurans TaxID=86665 RepID=A0A0M0KGF1_ALKHA|nr:NAD-dependent epimerase/dehydratase family protein [Halalkalibacterium halodurans]TPE68327.1 NAD-dependent epimerase/dehydratase family protein [Halalkalibacterium halodurans]
MRERRKILITGAGGFTGQHACNYFNEKGYDVIAVTRKSPLSTKNVEMEACDLTDQKAVINLINLTKPHFLLHLAGQNHVGTSWHNPTSSFKANVLSSLHLIEAVRYAAPNCKIVIVGSALECNLGDLVSLTNPYSLEKTLQVLIAKAWVHLYGLNIVIVKPSNLIGPGPANGVCSIFARKIVHMEKNKLDKVLEINNLYAQRDYIDVRDAVRAYELALLKGHSGEVYEIASGISRSLEEVIHVMKSLTVIDFEVKSDGQHQVEKPFNISIDKIAALGWKPTISFKTSINDILMYYRKRE